MLTVHNLTKYFGETKAVDAVNFTVQEGEIFSLIGPNSSGKTTIIKTILGLLQPTTGTITVNGYDVLTSPEKAKSVIGYIPDEPSVWQYMTGEEFLKFTQALFSSSKKIHNSTLSSLLSIFSLQGIEQKTFEEYSRGNKQKFSIIAALSHTPRLLLVDEPIVGLDPTGAEIAKQLFIDHAKKHNGAILLVTHTLSVAEQISDRIGFLKNGSLVAVGTLEDLRKKAGLNTEASLEDVYKKLAQ
ncbi:MAG: hypothetical protein RLZZ308_658 [Candidatus Parcubacteria bacterium]|jgi:ABC-2 type transport system ATP-binding protein